MLLSVEHLLAISRIRLACGPGSSGPRSMSLMFYLHPFVQVAHAAEWLAQGGVLVLLVADRLLRLAGYRTGLDAHLCREFRDELVRGLLLLTAQDDNDDAPRFVQAICGVWKFMLYGAMQACQFVARHSGIHVMFDVVVHVPVEKLHNRVEVNRACAQAEIFDLVP